MIGSSGVLGPNTTSAGKVQCGTGRDHRRRWPYFHALRCPAGAY